MLKKLSTFAVNHIETLKREFIEEAGLTIIDCCEFVTIDCFWYTKDNRDMESLANFYIVEVSDNITTPTEEGSKLIKLQPNNVIGKLPLSYQKKAIELFFVKD